MDCEIDLGPGGIFRTVMESPEGEHFPMTGCYLELAPPGRLVWTNALGPGYRPVEAGNHGPCITACVSLLSEGSGTRYTSIAFHQDEAARRAHEAMGFQEGWGKALDQLVAVVRRLPPG